MAPTNHEQMPPPSSRSSIGVRGRRLITALAEAALVVVAVAAVLIWNSLHGPPFQMVIEPDGDHATVQFSQVGTDLVSKPFRIDSQFEKRQVVVLDAPAVTVPGGRVEFADTTVMPGRFKIRVGQTVFDVMSRGIDVDGQQYEWQHAEPAP